MFVSVYESNVCLCLCHLKWHNRPINGFQLYMPHVAIKQDLCTVPHWSMQACADGRTNRQQQWKWQEKGQAPACTHTHPARPHSYPQWALALLHKLKTTNHFTHIQFLTTTTHMQQVWRFINNKNYIRRHYNVKCSSFNPAILHTHLFICHQRYTV